MTTLAWATDVHLDFVDDAGTESFCAALEATAPDAILLGGDIATADGVVPTLTRLARRLARPVYFVLGNHDYYGGGIADTRRAVQAACAANPDLRWLTGAPPIALGARTGLLGHDGWGDARHGDFARTRVRLNDFVHIRDLVGLDHARLGEALRALGDQAAADVRRALGPALDRFEELIFLTHVPPFREACWHGGKLSDDEWLPFFTCKAVGDALREAMAARPDRRMTVLCGHTHGAGEAQLLPNLRAVTGGAAYGRPQVQPPLVVP